MEDEVLELSDDQVIDLTKTRLRKRERIEDETKSNQLRRLNKEKEIFNSFQFNKEDEPLYISAEESNESSYEFNDNVEEEIGRQEIRNMLGIQDEEIALFEAFLLLNIGQVDGFLDSEIIKLKFKPAMVLLEHIYNKNVREKLWKLLWNKNLSVRELKYSSFKDLCLACNKPRMLSYMLSQENPKTYIGIMGCDCFEVRFQKLINLRDLCYSLSEIVYDEDFYDVADQSLSEMIDLINSAEAEMKSRYPN